LPLATGSCWELASYDHNEQNSLDTLVVNSSKDLENSEKKIKMKTTFMIFEELLLHEKKRQA
jgi:hypothetical protein